MKYTWSFNKAADRWDSGKFNTVGACIADARRDDAAYGGHHKTVYVGVLVPFDVKIDAESVLEQLQADASEFAGETGDDWEAFDGRMKDELSELSKTLTVSVKAWQKKYGYKPDFYAIESITAHDLEG